MSERLTDLLLWPLADVSIRWGLLVLALAAWFAARPPRRAATRHMLCVAALLAGPALLLAPRWDAYVYGIRPTTAADFAPIPVPDFSRVRPLAPAQVEAIEARVAVEARSRPSAPATPVDWPGAAAKAAVAAWLAGTLLMLARLALGVRSLRRWAREATPATADDRATLDACRAALPTSRPVRLTRHPGAAAPVMVGGRRPTIMLPPDWDAWPADRRRAALLHELAHVRRYDDASKLLEELIRVPAWFHPAVAWLLARIDRERELLCDEAAVATGDDPKGLARLLLDLSRSPSPRRLPSASLPFLTRRTTAVRIRRLLEDDMPRTLSRPSLARTLLLGPAALAALLALGSLRVRPASAQDAPSPAAYSDVKFSIQFIPASPPAAPRPIEGIVVDPEKGPIAGATVVVQGEAETGRRVLTTDEAGRFSTPGPSKPEHVDVIAFKPGFAPTVQYRRLAFGGRTGVAAAPESLMLQRPAPFTAVLVDEQDRPLAGAEVRVVRTATFVRFLPLPGDDPSSARRYQTFPRRAVEGTPVERALIAKTAEDGSFSLPEAVGGDSGLRLEIVAADGRVLIVRRPAAAGPSRSLEQDGFVANNPDRRARLVVIAGSRVEGRVATRVPGVDVSRLRVELAADRPSLRSPATSPNLIAAAHVGDDGRFVMDGLDGGAAVILVHGEGEGRTWTYRAGREIELKPGETASPTIELIEGVEVAGVVVSADDDRPVAGARVGVNGPFRPATGEATFATATDADGRYRLRLPPGRTFLFIQEPPEGFDRAWGRSTADVTIPEGVAAFEAPPLAVSGERSLHGRVVDAQSRPIPDARVVLLGDPSIPPAATDEIGKFLIRPPGAGLKADQMAAFEIRLGDGREFRRAAVADASGSVGDLVAAPDPAPPARFMPAADARPIEGMVVDQDDRPIEGATVVVDCGIDLGRLTLTTDAAGRFSSPVAIGDRAVSIVAGKPGFAPRSDLPPLVDSKIRPYPTIKLARAEPFSGVLVDEAERPIVGATVRVVQVESIARTPTDRPPDFEIHNSRFRRERTDGTPIDRALTATTGEDGAFVLPEAADDGAWIKFEIAEADGRRRILRRSEPKGRRWTREQMGFVKVRTGVRRRLVTTEAARIEGRVVSRVPGVDLSKLRVEVSASMPKEGLPPSIEALFRRGAAVDAEGRFAIGGLEIGPVDVEVHGDGLRKSWVCRPVRQLPLAAGATAATVVEVVPGVEVVGKVVSEKTGRPIADAAIEIEETDEARRGRRSIMLRTDAEGRYTCRLLPGKTYPVSLQGLPAGYPPSKWSQSLSVPEGATTLAGPTFRLADAGAISGRLLDADDRPVAGAKVEFLTIAPPPANNREAVVTDDRGAFRLQPGPGRGESGKSILLWIELADGRKFKAQAAPDAAGECVVKFAERLLPTPRAGVLTVARPPATTRQEAARDEGSAVAAIEGTVVDADGKPVAGATVVVAGDGDFGRRTLTTDDAGRFSTPGAQGEGVVDVLVSRPGYAPESRMWALDSSRRKVVQRPLVLTLFRPAPFAATLVDEEDRPIAGATVRVVRTAVAGPAAGRADAVMTIYHRFPRRGVEGTPMDRSLTAQSAEDGTFTLAEAVPAGSGLRLEILTPDGRPRIIPRPQWDGRDWSLEDQGFVVARPGEAVRLKTLPAARIEGKVVSKVPGVDVSRLRAWIQASQPGPGDPSPSVNLGGETSVDAEGRFAFDGLEAGAVNVFVRGEGEAEAWTYRAVKDLTLEPGRASAAAIELIAGVEVSGLVTTKDGGRPIPGAEVAVYGPFRPRTGAATLSHPTDADGRYRFRLPAGETYLYIINLPEGYPRAAEQPEGNRTVTIPEGVARFEVPPLRAEPDRARLPEATEKAAPVR